MQNAQKIFDSSVSALPDSEKLELAALIMRSVTAPRRKVSAAEFLKQLPKRSYRTTQQVDEDIRRERDSWDE